MILNKKEAFEEIRALSIKNSGLHRPPLKKSIKTAANDADTYPLYAAGITAGTNFAVPEYDFQL